MKLFGLKDENGKEYVLNVTNAYKGNTKDINVYPIEPTPKFKVGDWIISTEYPSDGVVRISEIFGNILYFTGCLSNGNEFHSEIKSQFVRPATASEIKSHLIKEAERRGFKNNVKYKDPVNEKIHKLRFDKLYYCEGDILTDGWGGAIYQDGQWATIIPDKKPLPKTKDELTQIFYDFALFCSECSNFQYISQAKIDKFLGKYED